MQPLVIIHCLAYNQAPYIEKCLQGFVMQRTTFPFYAVVHDDASTDGTADIIRRYAEQYPDIIHPLLDTENLWRKGGGLLSRRMDEACCGARYLSYCEGDDYWTDPLKLQKQVDFMESHPDFSVCYHAVAVLDVATGNMDTSDAISDGIPAESDVTLLARYNYIHTPAVLYRYDAAVHSDMLRMGPLVMMDYARNLLYADRGRIMRLPDMMAVYRQGAGVFSTRSYYYMVTQTLVCMAQVLMLLRNPEAIAVLKARMSGYMNRDPEAEVKRLRNTRAFRLGKALLRPATWLRQLLCRK